MGVLNNLTDEYFGNKVRKEDMKFRYDIDHDNPPKHTLTPKEVAFMRGLAKTKKTIDYRIITILFTNKNTNYGRV